MKIQLLPTVDPATHTLELRLDLPAAMAGVTPGMFARAWLPVSGTSGPRAVRAGTRGGAPCRTDRASTCSAATAAPLLRQVRLGPVSGDHVEVLSGLSAGERVVLDPQAAARLD